MKRLSDEEWLAAARRRYAVEGPSFDVAPDLDASPEQQMPAAPLVCPGCEDGPILSPFPHYILATPVPVQFCSRCQGVWAPAGSLSAGISADADAHPALRAAKAPPRCRACFGWLMPDGACARCKKAPPPLDCPECRAPMGRGLTGTERLDHCGACGGAWFETGEFPQTYGIVFRKSLVERAAEYREAENGGMLGGILGVPIPSAGAGHHWWGPVFQAVAMLLRLRF